MSGRIHVVMAALGIAVSACAPRDSLPADPARAVPGLARCLAGPDGEAVCLEARLDCRHGEAACEPAIDDPVGQLHDLDPEGVETSFRAGAMSSVSRANHFQSIQRLPGAGSARFVVTRETALREETDIGLVEAPGGGRGGGVSRAFDTGTPFTHAGGTQRVGRLLVVPLERGAGGSAVHLYDFSRPAAPVLVAAIEHRGARGELLPEAGAAGMAALADGRHLLVVGTRHSRRLDFYLSRPGDLTAGGWRHLDRWDPRELETATGDRTFGAYQGLQLVAGSEGALYLLGSYRRFFHRDRLDLHQIGVRRGAGGRPAVRLLKVGEKHLDCRGGAADRCNLDAGAGLYIDRDRRLRVYAIGYAAARVAFRPPRAQAAVPLVEFRSRGAAGSRAARDRGGTRPPGTSPRR